MSTLNRRQLLANILGGLVQTAGTVVLARSVLAAGHAQGQTRPSDASPQSQASLQERADQVAAEQAPLSDEEEYELCSFLNGGFRKGGFANGGFVNGGFRKGGFANGGFANGGFHKGGFANGGGFRNGGFANGGFGNGGGFRKGGFLN
jgi:hypothetical protein